MTRFQKDMRRAKNGEGVEVIKERRAEIAKLTKEMKTCKNGFRTTCLAQEIAKLQTELNEIDNLF